MKRSNTTYSRLFTHSVNLLTALELSRNDRLQLDRVPGKKEQRYVSVRNAIT